MRAAFEVARVFDGERLLDGPHVVLVEEGRIVSVEPGVRAPDGWPAHRHDGTLLPGLIDAHVHLCADSGPGALDRLAHSDAEQVAATIEASLRTHLAAGVTTVRDLGDLRDAVLHWRGGGAPGLPYVVASGRPLTSAGGHCWTLGGAVNGVDELLQAVRERAALGADVIKIMASGGVLTPGTDTTKAQFSGHELRQAVDEAHRLGVPVTAHAHALEAVRLAADAGVDGIEHCTCLTADGVRLDDELVDRLAGSGIAVCATLGSDPAIVVPPEVIAYAARAGITEAALQETAARLRARGVRMVAGSDGGIGPAKPHGLLPRTLEEYVRSGWPAEAALAAATSVAAHALGLAGRKGRIQPGRDADLLIVAGDPTRDITTLLEPVAVHLGGA
ncbi:amidohydrolase family protein [Nonomuraea sp. NPDC050310]|uniref:metal-dependent hydrolase family protein n=1 Tax=Nonomuraea sp. NPDC050310 TaxID=3154935 RepID=UPI00340B2E18